MPLSTRLLPVGKPAHLLKCGIRLSKHDIKLRHRHRAMLQKAPKRRVRVTHFDRLLPVQTLTAPPAGPDQPGGRSWSVLTPKAPCSSGRLDTPPFCLRAVSSTAPRRNTALQALKLPHGCGVAPKELVQCIQSSHGTALDRWSHRRPYAVKLLGDKVLLKEGAFDLGHKPQPAPSLFQNLRLPAPPMSSA